MPRELMSTEVAGAVEKAVDALVEATYAAAPWLPNDGSPRAQHIRIGARNLISAALGLAGEYYVVLRVGNREDATLLAGAVSEVMRGLGAPLSGPDEHDVMVALSVVDRMAARTRPC